MPFNLIQLETFRRLAHEQNFTRTAELLNLTQPAVTQHVRALQEHFSVKLVDLVGRKTVLTDAGRFLAARAETLLGNVAALEREMREFADVRAGELRIGATLTIGTYALPELVARFHAAYPAIRARVEIANTASMALAVKDGRVSLALVEGPLVDDDLDIERFADDELVLIVAPGHDLAKMRQPIHAKQLAGVPFVLREEGSGTRLQIERTLLAAGVAPDVALTLPTGEGIVRAVELGIGVAIISRLIAHAPVRDGRVAQLHIRGVTFTRTLRVVRLRRQTPSPAALAFTALLRNGGA
ncbi:MAG: selenium metabolism-associated LysR family transcriptional regulator [Vulcanimicrobiaceae bacterium]